MSDAPTTHQYLPLSGIGAVDEALIADRVISFLYSTAREHPSILQRMAASRLASTALATWEFDWPLRKPLSAIAAAAERMQIGLDDVYGDMRSWRTLRDLFERKIRFWDARPLDTEARTIASPADGKALAFGFPRDALMPVKSKWVAFPELVGSQALVDSLAPISGVIVRLTPDAYHYVHAPVSGVVRSHELIDGALHSCNPTALVTFANPYTINLRRVTAIDTDVHHGSRVGLVVVVNIAAMMIGRIEDAYSESRYDNVQAIKAGTFVKRGQPMALFRPGSSTSIVLWRQSRASLAPALARNSGRPDVQSRFSDWLLSPWVESAVRVRSTLAVHPGLSREYHHA
jgi:phosphatidylserine decarboxylase